MVDINDIVSSDYAADVYLTLYNITKVATSYFQTIVDFQVDDDSGRIGSGSIEISRSQPDPNESDVTNHQNYSISKGHENTKATLTITSIRVYNNQESLSMYIPKLYIFGAEGPITDMNNVPTGSLDYMFNFTYAGDQKRISFEIDFASQGINIAKSYGEFIEYDPNRPTVDIKDITIQLPSNTAIPCNRNELTDANVNQHTLYVEYNEYIESGNNIRGTVILQLIGVDLKLDLAGTGLDTMEGGAPTGYSVEFYDVDAIVIRCPDRSTTNMNYWTKHFWLPINGVDGKGVVIQLI